MPVSLITLIRRTLSSPRARFPREDGRVAPALFLCLFAGQAGIIALSPVLPEVADDMGVSTATAGQLRTVSGFVAGLAAIAMGRLVARLGLRDLLVAGALALAAGSLLSAAAPSFAVLAAAQVAVGLGLAVVLSAAPAAAAEWSPPERRAHVLSWTLIGQPVAWIVGMPVIGLLGDVSWRWGWIAVPFAGSLLAMAALTLRPADAHREQPAGAWGLLRRDWRLAGWGLGELLAFSAWAGTLVYTGALFVESYGASVGTVGLLLGAAAIAYLPGNFLARRRVHTSARELVAVAPLVAAGLVAALGVYRPSLAWSAVVFTLLAFVSGARTMAGSALGLEIAAQRRIFGMRIRAAATQFGYLLGAAAGGIALAAGGYAAVGVVFASLFLLAAMPHLAALLGERRAGQAGSPESLA